MNRCKARPLAEDGPSVAFPAALPRTFPRSASTRRRTVAALALAAGLCAAAVATAQVRPFPDAALRGQLQVVAPPMVQIDGRDAQLSPGARIRNPQNLFVLSGSLVGQDLPVNYVRDTATGQIGDIWLLSPEEAAVRRASARQPSWFDRLFGS